MYQVIETVVWNPAGDEWKFQGENIETLLERMKVRPRDLLPIQILFKEITSPIERFGLSSWVPFLPLELFDDEEFDIRQTSFRWPQQSAT